MTALLKPSWIGVEVDVPAHRVRGTVTHYTGGADPLLTIDASTGDTLTGIAASTVRPVGAPATEPAPETQSVEEKADFSDVSTADLAAGLLVNIERGKRLSKPAIKALAERVLGKSGRAAR